MMLSRTLTGKLMTGKLMTGNLMTGNLMAGTRVLPGLIFLLALGSCA